MSQTDGRRVMRTDTALMCGMRLIGWSASSRDRRRETLDPLLYGSFMHLFVRLRERFKVTIVPGVASICGAWGAAKSPMTWGDDSMVVLPATLPLEELIRRLALADAAVVMKIGRNFARAREALAAAGMAERAIYVERATMTGEAVMPLKDKPDGATPYFSMILVPGRGRRP